MDAVKKIIIITIICIILTLVSTYFFVDTIKQSEIDNIQIYHEDIMNNLNSYVSFIEDKNNELKKEIDDIKESLNYSKSELEIKNISLLQNISELEQLQSGDNYDLHDPTYNELLNFIENDKTNEEIYIEDVFDCEQFSQQVNTNAENIGIRCAYVIIYFNDIDAGHGIVGFNTVDRGMVYIEPQTDEWVENLEIGNDFWTDCIIPNGNYYYEESPNDTIKEILLFW